MDKISGLYKIVNKINKKFYIGSSNNIHCRFLSHLNELKKKIRNSVINSIKNGNGIRNKLCGKHEEIKQLYLSGNYTQKQLSTIYNVRPTFIYTLLKRLGVK